MDAILSDYGKLLSEVDGWFSRCSSWFGSDIACNSGCSDCCRGLFDITLLDACYLKNGVDLLPAGARTSVTTKSHDRLAVLQKLWAEFDVPYLLNTRPEEMWDELMPEDDETPCVLLDDNGHCLVYEYRPMTCRLHGLPLIDVSGEVMHDEWCTLNFVKGNPLELAELRWEFAAQFREEMILFRKFTLELFGMDIRELDTFIPMALLFDFRKFSWKRWWGKNHLLLSYRDNFLTVEMGEKSVRSD